MILAIKNVLSQDELNLVIDTINQSEFIDGKMTAGWHAKLVKNNNQLAKNTTAYQQLTQIIINALNNNQLFQAAIQPKKIHTLLFSRYLEGMSYGGHIDNAVMGKEELFRADVSFTLFLNSPSEYDGGQLIIEDAHDERKYKLEANGMIVYPSSTFHRVETVTKGIRLVAVGWVQSLVRDVQKREILFDLDTVRRSIFAKEGKTLEFDLLSKSYSNLLRQWME